MDDPLLVSNEIQQQYCLVLSYFVISYWCSLVEAKGPLISMELFFFVFFVVSNHNFACSKEHHRLAQLG